MAETSVRRTRKLGAALSGLLILGVVMQMTPAFATAANTAFVNAHNVLAGQAGKVFTIRVENDEAPGLPGGVNAGKTINEVRIRGPVDLIDAVLPGTSGPAPFTDIRLIGTPPVEVRFFAPSGGIAPNAGGTFTIAADVRGTPARDLEDTWRVRVSSGGGQFSAADTIGTEGLLTKVRVLQVQSVAVVAPVGAADDRDGDGDPEVTGTQGNICVRTRVANAASVALPVTPGLSGGSFSVQPPRVAATPPCSGAEVPAGGSSIPAKSSRDFDFVLTADNVSGPTASELTGTASAPNASTPPTTDPDDDVFITKEIVDIEPKAVLSYVANSLTPRAVVPDTDTALEENFSLNITKGPGGSPPLPTLSGQFESEFCDVNPAVAGIQFPQQTAPTSLGGGLLANQNVTYQTCDIAKIADGRYQPTATYAYTDGNGLQQALTALNGTLEKVRLDSLIPAINNLKINVPASQVTTDPACNCPVPGAVTNADADAASEAFTADANVTDSSPDAPGTSLGCGPNPAGSTTFLPCTLETVHLVQYPLPAAAGGGTETARRIDIKHECSLASNGNLSCSINLDGATVNGSVQSFDVGTQATQIVATVKDETGNIGTGLSALVDVDIEVPKILEAETARGGTVQVGNQQIPGQRRTISVTFSEPVEDSNVAQDWVVQEDGETKAVCNVNQSGDRRTVTLVTCQELNADTTGLVTYDPRLVTSSPYHDRVGQEIVVPPGGLDIPLEDGIAPLAPTFFEVEDRALQDDSPSNSKFFFNTVNPKVELIQEAPASEEDPAIADGYTVEVYEETDGTAGLDRNTDDLVCKDVAVNFDITFEGADCDFSGIDRTSKVYALSIDFNDNIGLNISTDWVLDRVRPAIGSVTVTAAPSEITVTFTERVPRGADDAGNWTYIAERPNGEGRTAPDVEGIRAGTGTDSRVLDYADEPYNPSTLTPDELRYDHVGGDRYEDRAGNTLLDVHFIL